MEDLLEYASSRTGSGAPGRSVADWWVDCPVYACGVDGPVDVPPVEACLESEIPLAWRGSKLLESKGRAGPL